VIGTAAMDVRRRWREPIASPGLGQEATAADGWLAIDQGLELRLKATAIPGLWIVGNDPPLHDEKVAATATIEIIEIRLSVGEVEGDGFQLGPVEARHHHHAGRVRLQEEPTP